MTGIQGIHEERVSQWLAAHIDGVQAPFRFELIAGGHSNLTYRVTDAEGTELVLRRPPLGHVLESAHDMAREHRIISALHGSKVPVAETLGLCTDVAVNDAPFYVMRFVQGVVIHDRDVAEEQPESFRQPLAEHLIEVLAALHNTDADAVGLGELGRKEGYLARQVKRWNRQWEASKTEEVPQMEALGAILQARMPAQVGSSIVHGDYRLGNLMVRETQVVAVLDWELCTLGDPLADVGYLLNYWVLAGEEGAELSPTAVPGYPDREALCARYAQLTGRDLSDIDYYRAFSHWRSAAIAQGVYKRYITGAMGEDHGVDLSLYQENIRSRAQVALDLLGENASV